MSAHYEVAKAVRRWLGDHYGVISPLEALQLGMSKQMIRSKVANGEWLRMYPGVYRDAGFPRNGYQELRAACVAIRAGQRHRHRPGHQAGDRRRHHRRA